MTTPAATLARGMARLWTRLGPEFLPFADAASVELPLPRLLRLSLFQVTVGMATVLLIGTLNRVLIVELGVPAWLVSLMVGLPLVFAPFRALVGFRSDNHRSALGWRRVPYIWMGTLLQFGGLAIMPFALILLSGDNRGPAFLGQFGAALAFLLTGVGLQVTQTAGLALATDLAPAATRPRVVALMYVMLLVGMVGAGLGFGRLLQHFSELRLIQVVQAAALLTFGLNSVALWKQEARDPSRTSSGEPRRSFAATWQAFLARDRARRFLVVVALGTAAFNMQDIVLEPYGGEVLHLPVGATTTLTAMLAAGMLAAFAIAARRLAAGVDPCRLAAYGVVVGLFAFAAVVLSAPLESPLLFRIGGTAIGFGGGLFAVGTLADAMARERGGDHGLALGAWGAAQAGAAGLAIFLGGALRDGVGSLARDGALGPAMVDAATGYGAVYALEILLLFVTLAVIGPLVGVAGRRASAPAPAAAVPLGLVDCPR
ncbi:MAG: BCD family MFS transporter [Proteobacteria bacterium]|nr:BCD family MFS transporter [Pseudomonadota bacterium]